MTATDLHPVLDHLRARALEEATYALARHVPALRNRHLDRAAELDALADLVERAMAEGLTP